jgi:DNA-binding NtrC family response regulator
MPRPPRDARRDWSIQELEKMIDRMMLPLTRRPNPHQIDKEVSRKLKDGGVSLKEIARTAAQAAESGVILLSLQHTHWNRARAAQLLNVSYRTLLYKIEGLGLHPATRPAQGHPDRLGTGPAPNA